MSLVAGVFGAPLRTAPNRQARIIGFVTPGVAVEGDVIEGARVRDNAQWLRLVCYVWEGRLTEPPAAQPPPVSERGLPARCGACGQFIGAAPHRCRWAGAPAHE